MKIGFYGATGSMDFGDYAMMIHNIQELWSYDSTLEFYIFTPNKYNTLSNFVNNILDSTKLKQIHCVAEPSFRLNLKERILDKIIYKVFKKNVILEWKYKKFQKGNINVVNEEFKTSMQKIDLLLFNGGGYLQHSWNISNYYFCMAIDYAKNIDKTVYFLGNSIWCLKGYEKIVKNYISKVDKILIRDGENYTKRFLDDCGVHNYLNGPDDLTFVNDMYHYKIQYKNFIAMEIMAWINKAKKGDIYIIGELIKFVDYITDNGKEVVLVLFDEEDIIAKKYMNYIKINCKNKNMVHIEKQTNNMYKIFGIYNACDFSVSFKYHPQILAMGSNKSFISVICDDDGYYESKLIGACENFNVDPQKHVIHLDELNYKLLIEMYKSNRLNNEYNAEIRNKLKNIRNSYLKEILQIGKEKDERQ